MTITQNFTESGTLIVITHGIDGHGTVPGRKVAGQRTQGAVRSRGPVVGHVPGKHHKIQGTGVLKGGKRVTVCGYGIDHALVQHGPLRELRVHEVHIAEMEDAQGGHDASLGARHVPWMSLLRTAPEI